MQKDINKMMKYEMFVMNDKHIQSEHEHKRSQDSGK